MLHRIIDRALDWHYGVSTGGIVETNVSGDSRHASTISYRAIGRLLDALELVPDEVFVDIGCGKGRVLLLASFRRIQLAVGIEASPIIVAEADDNFRKIRRRLRAPVEVCLSFAEAFDYSDCTAGYCFNAFGSDTLGLVLQKIRHDRSGRPFRLCFLNATPGHLAVFADEKWRMGASGSAARMPFVVEHQIH